MQKKLTKSQIRRIAQDKKALVAVACPECKKNAYIVSVFGSICSNCFYEPKKLTIGSNGKVKNKITFKKGIKTIHIPLGFVMELPDGSYCVNPRRDIAKFMENNVIGKNAKLTYHVDFNDSGVREITLTKK